jgi:hypothetical protein
LPFSNSSEISLLWTISRLEFPTIAPVLSIDFSLYGSALYAQSICHTTWLGHWHSRNRISEPAFQTVGKLPAQFPNFENERCDGAGNVYPLQLIQPGPRVAIDE